MDISVDDMFYEKRKSLGLDTRNGKSLHNEEGSWFRNGGDVLGQWTQALARFYKAEQDEKILKKYNK